MSLLLVVSFVTIITRKIVLAAVFRALAIIMTIIASEYVRCEKKTFKNIGVGGDVTYNYNFKSSLVNGTIIQITSSLIECARSYFDKHKYTYRIIKNHITLTYAMIVACNFKVF